MFAGQATDSGAGPDPVMFTVTLTVAGDPVAPEACTLNELVRVCAVKEEVLKLTVRLPLFTP